jgi:hypothetical protein
MGGRLGYANSQGSKVVAARASTVLGRSLQRNGRVPSTGLGLRMGQYVQSVNAEELEVIIQVSSWDKAIIMGVANHEKLKILFASLIFHLAGHPMDHVLLSCMAALHNPSSKHGNKDTRIRT